MSDPNVPLNAQQTADAEARALHEGRLREIITAADVFVNVLTGGKPDMTISARAAIAAEHGSEIGIVLSRFLNDFQPNHGPRAVAGDTARADALEAITGDSGEVTTQEATPSPEPAISSPSVDTQVSSDSKSPPS